MSDENAPAHLLIVDDEPLNLKVLIDLLRPYYALAVAKDGLQALERLRGPHLPDLILSDVMMPHMDGFEFCRQLKADPNTQHIPVIFMGTSKNLFVKALAMSRRI